MMTINEHNSGAKMHKIFLLLTIFIAINGLLVSNVTANDKGGEVGNPVASKKVLDHCLNNAHETGNFLCLYKGDLKYSILKRSEALERGIDQKNSTYIEDCLTDFGANKPTRCRSNGKKVVTIDKKLVEEAGVPVSNVKYCTLDYYENVTCDSNDFQGRQSISKAEADLRGISYKGKLERIAELTDIGNCTLNESNDRDEVWCDAKRPDGEVVSVYFNKPEAVYRKLALRKITQCETVTREYAICKEMRFIRDKSQLGVLTSVMISIASKIGPEVDNKCFDLSGSSVRCNNVWYIRDKSIDDSPRKMKVNENPDDPFSASARANGTFDR